VPRGFRFPVKPETSPTDLSESAIATSPSISTASSHLPLSSVIAATQPSAVAISPSAEIAELTGIGRGSLVSPPGATDPSVPETSTIASPTERELPLVGSPTIESQSPIPEPAAELPSPKIGDPERSLTIDEAVAKFHEAMGSAPKEPVAPIEEVVKIAETPPSEMLSPKHFSPDESRLALAEPEEEPPFRRHTPTHMKTDGNHSQEHEAYEEVDVMGEGESEGTTMDEIDLN